MWCGTRDKMRRATLHVRRGLILTYLRNNSHLGLYAGGARWQVLAHRNRSKQTAAAMARPHDRLATGSGA
jgi:hypothetical protein